MTLDEINAKLGGKYPISAKQFEFCKSFAVHGVGMRAVREAGFSHSTPGAQSSAAYRLLRLQKIQECVSLIKSNG